MRRTQQNADRQRRRGVRSRLVACVAAVAMLVTSVAAGTAVAAELGGSDAADQTTQNTATLEQQETGNTGDGDQAATNGDGQADGNQSSDADSGSEGDEGTADNGAADGTGTTESDVQSQSDAAAKSANAVPAPQSDGAADAESLTANAGARAGGDGDSITVNMFDYTCQSGSGDGDCYVSAGSKEYPWSSWQSGDFVAYDSGINKDHDFKFLNNYNNNSKYLKQNEESRPDTWNVWTNTLGGDYANSRYAGIVQGELKDGSPVLNVGSQESLAYLFDPGSTGNDVTDIRRNVQGLITRGNDGYYEYDSDKNSATLLGNNVHLGRWTGKFMPFGSSDQYFGMTVESQFYMPEGGMVDGEPMKFEFSGDDDVWVFIDGKLVLDLGGIHDKVSGSIDFSTGEVVTLNNKGAQTSKTYLSDTFGLDWESELSGKRHTLKMFYLERGGDASNCKIRFNMPQVPSDRIQIAKQVTGAATEEDLNKEYRFKVYVDRNNGNGEQLYEDGYTVGGDTHQASDGVIIVPANGNAVLSEQFEHGSGATYRVVELSDSIDGFEVSAMDADGETLEVTSDDEGITTGSVAVSESPLVTVRNNKSLGEPAHRKYITKKDGANDEYTLHLDVTGRNESSSSDTGTAADVVLVLDGSTSMGRNRLQQLKDAANGLVDKLLTDENSKLPEEQQTRVGVMWFSDDADPTDFKQGYGTQYFTVSSQQAVNAIDSGTADGNTYWNNAIDAVTTYYSSDRDAARYVVFVTDGAPSKSGYEFNADLYNKAVTSGKQIVQAGWNVVNVSVDLSEQIYVDPDAESLTDGNCSSDWHGGLGCTVDHSNQANWGQSKKNQDWVNTVAGLTGHEKNVAQPGQTVEYVSAKSGELNEIFGDLAETITSTSEYEIVSISDTLSQWVEPVDWTSTGDVTNHVKVSPEVSGYTVKYDAQTRTVMVTFPEGYRPANGTTVTVSFDVQPSANAYESYAKDPTYPDQGGDSTDDPELDQNPGKWISTHKDGFKTNDEAHVTYREVVDGEAGANKEASYLSPVVTVRTGSITVVKEWDPYAPQGTGSVTVDLYKDNGENPVASANLTADEGEWSYTFANLAPGTYTVREQSEVSGYASEVTYKNELTSGDDDDITFTGDDLHKAAYDAGKSFTVTVTNTLLMRTVNLTVLKQLVGRPWNEDDSFTFLLKPTGDNAEDAPGPSGDQVRETDDGWELTVDAGDFQGDDFQDDDLRWYEFEFAVPSSSESVRYTYTISEAKPDDAEPGMTYSNATWSLTLNAPSKDNGYYFDSPVLTGGSDGASKNQPDTRAVNRQVTFVNTYVAPVSALPLTGGDSTARTLLLAGGGVLLVAGVAWLLARRRWV